MSDNLTNEKRALLCGSARFLVALGKEKPQRAGGVGAGNVRLLRDS